MLAVNDVARTADYYINVLGFSRDFAVEGWEFSLGEFRVMLGECPDEVPASETNNHSYFAYVLVEDVGRLFKDLRSQSAAFT